MTDDHHTGYVAVYRTVSRVSISSCAVELLGLPVIITGFRKKSCD